MAEPFITINGHEYPAPRRGLNFQISTIVDSARNANGAVVGQKVGRDQQKINNLQWGHLKAEVWESILADMEEFFVTVRYPDMRTGTWTTRTMYPGDRSAEPLWIDDETGLPTDYINCKVNLIDAGRE